jgi:hypothetical protein
MSLISLLRRTARSRLAVAALTAGITAPLAGSIAGGSASAAVPRHKLFAVVKADGTLVRSLPGAGVASSRQQAGFYSVTFPQNVSGCGFAATIDGQAGLGPEVDPVGFINAGASNQDSTKVFVDTKDKTGTAADKPFDVVVICP